METRGEEPEPGEGLNRKITKKIEKYEYKLDITSLGLLWRWLFRDVFGHPKNLLDFKRPIKRSGPLSIF